MVKITKKNQLYSDISCNFMPLPITFVTHSFHLYIQDALLTTLKSTLNTNLSYYTPITSCQANERVVSLC